MTISRGPPDNAVGHLYTALCLEMRDLIYSRHGERPEAWEQQNQSVHRMTHVTRFVSALSGRI